MAKRRNTLPKVASDGTRTTYKLKSQRSLIDQMVHRELTSGYALAEAAGLKPGAVNHLVFGRRTQCSLATAAGIEKALGVKPGDLFEPRVYEVRTDTNRRDAA